MELVVFLLIGLAVGAAAGFVVGRSRTGSESIDVLQARQAAEILEVRHAEAQEKALIQADLSRAQATASALKEQVGQLAEQHRRELAEREKANADESKVLQQMAPLLKGVDAMQRKVEEIEKQRHEQHGKLEEQIKAAQVTAQQSGAAAAQLASALSNNAVRGAYGETQLRSVVESAGMIRHVDFLTQESITTESGGRRPDMVINLPGGKQMAVDAKMPLADFLRSAGPDVTDAQRKQLLTSHAKAVKSHVDALAAKTYWTGLSASPEFTIAFIGNDAAFNAAIDVDPALTEYAFARGVVLATPTNLWAVLKTIAFTWQQEALTEDAKQLFDLGKELYGRIATMAKPVAKLGRSLTASVNDYNAFISSLETRVLVTARKLDAVDESKVLPVPKEIDEQPRRIVADEFTEALADVARPELELFDAPVVEILDDTETA
jgi:DNA recombination protein RmuC